MLIFLLFLLHQLFDPVYSGHLISSGVELNYNNAGYATEFRLTFSFSTPFSSSDYLKVIFPFSLHFTATNGIPDDMSASFYTNSGDYHCGSAYTGLANIYVDSTTQNSYYVQFLNSENLPNNDLKTGVFYTLVISLSETNANLQSTGVKQPIEVFSVSAMSSKAIVYDANTVFANIALNDYPTSDMELALTTYGSNSYNLSEIYNISLDIFTKKRISDAGRFQMRFVQVNQGFSFPGFCESVAKTTSPIISKLDPSIYNCSLDSDGKLVLFVNTTVEAEMGIRLNITVQNPGFVMKNVSLEVRSLLSFLNTIVEINQTDAVFSTSPIPFSYIKLSLAWGLDTSQKSLYPFALNIIRGDASTPTYYAYNTLQWRFTVSKSTSTSKKLRVVLKLFSPKNSMILAGSIIHNFPMYNAQSNSAARCYVPSLSDANSFQIVCDNVGTLLSTQEYFIGCRMYFPYDQWTQPLTGSFGSFTIYSFLVSSSVPDTYPLFSETKAFNSLQTSNNPNWFNAPSFQYDTTVVSTEVLTTASVNPPQSNVLGIVPGAASRLVFSLNMPLADVFSPVATAGATSSAITYGSGLVIMTNPSVSWDGVIPLVLEPKSTPSSGTSTVELVKYSTFNKITVASDHTSQIVSMYAYNTDATSTTAYNFFAINSLTVKNQTGLYADYDCLDFYIASFEQINTAFPAFRKLLLYNAYTITTTWTSQIRYGIANFWTMASSSNDGTSFPTLIRLSGFFDSNDLPTGFSGRLALFFNDLIPFYTNTDTSLSDEVSCFSTVVGTKCSYYSSLSMANGQSYQNLNRVEIDLLTSLSGSAQSFEVLIPVKTVVGVVNFDFFLGFMTKNVNYGMGTYYKLLSVYRLTGGSHIDTTLLAFSAGSALGTSFYASGISGAVYDLDTIDLTVGQTNVDLNFKAGHTDSSNAIIANTVSNSGAGFTISSSWNFTTYSSTFTFSVGDAVTISNQCLSGKYIPSFTGTVPTERYSIFCPYITGTESSSTILVVKHGKVPYSNGDQLPDDTSFVWSTNTGAVSAYKVNPSSVIPNHASLTFISVYPQPKKAFKQNILQWNFLPANKFLNGFVIKVSFSSTVIFTLAATGLYCELRYGNGTSISATCTVSLTTTTSSLLQYTISNCNDCPLDLKPLQINNWGINMPATSGSDTGFYFTIYSSAAYMVETSGLQTFSYNNSAVANTIILSDLKFAGMNKRTRGPVQFRFYMNDRSIWANEYLVINLGGVAKDNTLNMPNIRCMMLESNYSVSKLWSAIDLSDLTAITITPKTHINSTTNSSFIFHCDGVITPYSYNPTYITMYLEIQGTSSIIKSGDALTIDDGRFLDQYLFGSIAALLIDKNYNSPGSALDLLFNFTCANQDINMNLTNFILEFPVYYSPNLTNGLLLCQVNSIVAACYVNQSRRLLFEYIPVSIPRNTQFQVRVEGIDCPYEFITGSTFFFAVLPNASSVNYSQYGMITDQAPNSLPLNIQIFSLSISNLYIRSYSNYVFKVNFPAGAISSNRIIAVDFPNQWDLIINYNTPSCQIYNPDYSSQFATNCSSFANKVSIFLGSSDVTSNFYYLLVLNNVRNPDDPNCDIEPFVVSVTDLNYGLVSRSHYNQINKQVTSYLQNPEEINLRYVETSGAEISVFSADIGVYNKYIRVLPDYGIFAETITLTTSNANFGLYPSSVSCSFGATHCDFAIAAVENTLPGLYNLEVLKSENFDYHTRLPFLKVRVSKQIYSLSMEATSYDLPIGGFTLPIKLFFDGIIPQEEVKIDTKFVVGLTGLSFLNSSSLLLTPTNPRGILIVQADASKTIVGADGITLIKSGANSDCYNSLPTILLNVIKVTGSTQAALSLSSRDLSATGVTFDINCDQTSSFYYLLAVNESIRRNQSWIKNQAIWLVDFNSSDTYQEQYGFLNMINDQNTLTQSLSLSNLLTNVSYNFTGFCENSMGLRSLSQSLFVKANDNGGKHFKITVTSSILLSSGLVTSMGCFFDKLYKIPARSVKTVDNEICGNRRLLSTTDVTSTNTSNSSNSTSNNTTDASSSSSSSSSPFTYSLYFYPSDDQNTDIITPILTSSNYDNITLIDWILNNITGMPSISNLSSLQEIDPTPPTFDFSNFQINATTSYINLTRIKLSKPGFFYVGIEPIAGEFSVFLDNLSSNGSLLKSLPNYKNQSLMDYANNYLIQNLSFITWVQIRNGLTSQQENNPFGASRFILNKTSDEVANITFNGLINGTWYMISMYATAEDPSYSAQRSNTTKFIVNTTSIQGLTLDGERKTLIFLIFCFLWVLMN